MLSESRVGSSVVASVCGLAELPAAVREGDPVAVALLPHLLDPRDRDLAAATAIAGPWSSPNTSCAPPTRRTRPLRVRGRAEADGERVERAELLRHGRRGSGRRAAAAHQGAGDDLAAEARVLDDAAVGLSVARWPTAGSPVFQAATPAPLDVNARAGPLMNLAVELDVARRRPRRVGGRDRRGDQQRQGGEDGDAHRSGTGAGPRGCGDYASSAARAARSASSLRSRCGWITGISTRPLRPPPVASTVCVSRVPPPAARARRCR